MDRKRGIPIVRDLFIGLTDATIDPVPNLVYDSNGQFIAESSSWLPLRQFYSWPQPTMRAPASKLRGEFIFLPSNSYYHWLIEDLPVFLKSLAVSPRAQVILPRNAASYVREVAGLIDNDIVVVSSPTRVERLVMTGKTAGMGSPLAGLTPHPADIAILRKFFAKYLEPTSSERKVYLSRMGQKRSPANEHDLQRELEQQGFTRFDGAGMSLLSQIALFSSARQLIGLHGAAFSNIVWAPEGVDVCEIFSSAYLPSCYSALTAMRSGRYTSVTYTADADHMIDAATLERLAVIASVAGSVGVYMSDEKRTAEQKSAGEGGSDNTKCRGSNAGRPVKNKLINLERETPQSRRGLDSLDQLRFHPFKKRVFNSQKTAIL